VPRSIVLFVVLAAAVTALAGCDGSDNGSDTDIAFVSSRDGEYAIFAMSADGKGEHRLTPREGDAPEGESVFLQIDPAWSPDATKIAFVSARTGAPHVYVMNADGTGTKELTSGEKASDTHPSWSPDGASIVFARDGDIYVMGADGSNPTRISDINAQESDPSWSPDGDWIAYIKRTPGTPVQNLWVMHPDGTGRRALTKQAGRAFTPSWSPDSERIVFTMNRDESVFELFTIGLDGKRLRSVVPTVHDNFEPAWSPDGSKIAYQEDGAVFTVELGGGDVKRLTDQATNDSSPAWNPQPPQGQD
jgi:Tol biopolymer transport system component